ASGWVALFPVFPSRPGFSVGPERDHGSNASDPLDLGWRQCVVRAIGDQFSAPQDTLPAHALADRSLLGIRHLCQDSALPPTADQRSDDSASTPTSANISRAKAIPAGESDRSERRKRVARSRLAPVRPAPHQGGST